MNKNTVHGTAEEIGGKFEKNVGKLTGSTKTEAEGAVREVKGKAEKTYGNAKDTLKDARKQAEE